MYIPTTTSSTLTKWNERRIYRCTITDKDFAMMKMASSPEHFMAASATGTYGVSVKNAELVGRLGECAIAYLIGSGVDIEYRAQGDDTDMWVEFSDGISHSIDAKTSMKRAMGLVRATAKGKMLELFSDVYVFARLNNLDIDNGYGVIDVHGWLTRAEVLKQRRGRGIRYDASGNNIADWYNYECDFDELHNMTPLIADAMSSRSIAA